KSPAALAGLASPTALGKFVIAVHKVVFLTLGWQLGESSLNFAPDAADRDAKYALATLYEVNNLIGRGALINGGAIGHERNLCDVVNSPLTQVGYRGANLLQ